MTAIEEPDWPKVEMAPVQIGCSVCKQVIAVPVTVRMVGLAEPTLQFDPDMSDLWVHTWSHGDNDGD